MDIEARDKEQIKAVKELATILMRVLEGIKDKGPEMDHYYEELQRIIKQCP